MYWMEILVFLIGLCWGSFLALFVYRVPRGISVIKPRSFCDSCKTTIPFYYNLPIISYLFLKGRCKSCKTKIAISYPLIELITAVLFLISYQNLFYDYYSLIRSFLLITAIVPSVFIDIEHRIIPDRLSLGLIVTGFVLALFDPMMTWFQSLVGIVLGGGILFVVAWVYYKLTGREGLGGGDIKILAGLGALLGGYPVVLIMFMSSVIGSLYGIFMIIFFKKGRLTELAFGPFIGIAAIFYYFVIEGGLLG